MVIKGVYTKLVTEMNILPIHMITMSSNLVHIIHLICLGCGNLGTTPPVYELAGSLQILDLRSTKISSFQSQSFSDGNTPSELRELILEDNTCTGNNISNINKFARILHGISFCLQSLC